MSEHSPKGGMSTYCGLDFGQACANSRDICSIYIGYGTNDDASLGSGARALGALLKSAGWRLRVAEHPLGHGANEVYLDEAFAFWAEGTDVGAH